MKEKTLYGLLSKVIIMSNLLCVRFPFPVFKDEEGNWHKEWYKMHTANLEIFYRRSGALALSKGE